MEVIFKLDECCQEESLTQGHVDRTHPGACWDQGGFPASMQGLGTSVTPYKQQFSSNPGLRQNRADFLSPGPGVTWDLKSGPGERSRGVKGHIRADTGTGNRCGPDPQGIFSS